MKGLLLAAEPLRMWSYIWRMALLSLVPSLLLGALVAASGVFPEGGPKFEKGDFGSPVLTAGVVLALLVVFTPVAETLLMALGIKLLSLAIPSQVAVAVSSALLWAGLHSLASPGWGLVVCWPFFVFSCAYLAWRPRSWLHGVWVASCIHALQNLLPGLAMAVYLAS